MSRTLYYTYMTPRGKAAVYSFLLQEVQGTLCHADRMIIDQIVRNETCGSVNSTVLTAKHQYMNMAQSRSQPRSVNQHGRADHSSCFVVRN